jgi:hypothetical protein
VTFNASTPVGLIRPTIMRVHVRDTELTKMKVCKDSRPQWRTHEFCSGGGVVQQIQLRTEDRENGDQGAVAS